MKEVVKFSAAVLLAFIALAALVAPNATPLEQTQLLAFAKGTEQRHWGFVVDARSTPEGADVVIKLDEGGFISTVLTWRQTPLVGERVVLIQTRFGSSIERGQ
ncbi:MAG: hypothetical protein LW865_13050 [Betaproteobacteria bacterium]|jgi:hypothetical protein|nr:hypothetical protein [Betaproteobacteria bacterium]